jgi:hypothetical protein
MSGWPDYLFVSVPVDMYCGYSNVSLKGSVPVSCVAQERAENTQFAQLKDFRLNVHCE